MLSSKATVTAGAIAAPAVESVGWERKAIREAGSEIVYVPELTELLCAAAMASARIVVVEEMLTGPAYWVDVAEGADPSRV